VIQDEFYSLRLHCPVHIALTLYNNVSNSIALTFKVLQFITTFLIIVAFILEHVLSILGCITTRTDYNLMFTDIAHPLRAPASLPVKIKNYRFVLQLRLGRISFPE
jgi:hypothetical protein